MEPLPRLTQACAECKRMKLKCDKNNPCGSCIKRGCTAICPQGRMPPKNSKGSPGNANVELLHETIDTLKTRVRHLEEALESMQSQYCYEQPHPLLSEELRRIAAPPISPGVDNKLNMMGAIDEELAGSVGTLALNDKGPQYFSSIGAFAYFWKAVQNAEDPERKPRNDVLMDALLGLPPELSHLAYAFPTTLTDPDIATAMNVAHVSAWLLENCLPSYPEAWSLFENYWEHYSWHFSIFTRTKFVNQILSPIYRRSSGDESDQTPLGHRLGLLFMVFAIGDLMDFTKPFDLKIALHYYILARASLSLSPVVENPTLTALQAMHLMNAFGLMSHDIVSQEHIWVLTGINFKLALTLGLQHDSTKFNLPDDEVYNRQYTMVGIAILEINQSLTLGRPTSLASSSLNWIRPSYETIPGSDHSVQYWTACFFRDCTLKVMETVVAPKAISYNKILQLHKKITEYRVVDAVVDINSLSDVGAGEKIGRTLLFKIREVTLLFLHRRCFAYALRDHPEDPLRSAFAPSVRACYHSAASFISHMAAATAAVPEINERIWSSWPHVLVATVILGAIVARSPGCALASSAFLELENASQLWESVSDISGPRMREKLRQLKQKACTAFAQYHATHHDPLRPGPRPGGVEVVEEIAALGGAVGGTMTLSSRSNGHSPLPFGDDTARSSGSPGSSPPGASSTADSPDHFHETMQSFAQSFPSHYPASYSVPQPTDPQNHPKENFATQSQVQQGHAGPEPLPTDFNDIFGFVGDQSPPPPVLSGTGFLEQLGLMEEWQPTMDYLGF